MRAVIALVILASLGLFAAGCTTPAESDAPAVPAKTEPAKAPPSTPGKPQLQGAEPEFHAVPPKVDWKSDGGIMGTAVPHIKGALETDPLLKDATLMVTVKNKMIKIRGNVKSNDQKRKIDEITKAWAESVKAPATVKFVNEVVVG